ncbi:MAG: acetyl-CoA carboxylase biotin carboxylase subunit [Eubacterium sp.]|jgi:acetyl-CoA carboxylase biotin carboxylase subunit|nr:acetyl-CoA carboxylase biotin carboxylase subunit [Eubacterium sp.]
MFKKILIANRGEIAMRVLRCAQEMGIETVVAYSSEDAETLPVQFATEAVCIGPAPAAKSYLNQDSLIAAALAYHCEAIHPGYGFLSENAEFARKCEKNGIIFIGPSSRMIKGMGDKQRARALMKKYGVPVVPGSDGVLEDWKEAARIAAKVGYPVLIKASAGGGGRGMRTAYDANEIQAAFENAQAEALAAFGDGSMYLEKLIQHPHHIEVQILGDRKGHIIHLGERDCSMQRRNQKLLEEAPAKILTPRQREAIHKAAVRAAKAVHYVSAGTVEFVLDKEGNFYFIEMNTRIQVEHPVTEMITGVDLIREQIRIAAGLELSYRQSDIRISGHAIECRINAENPAKNFAPCPGSVPFLHFPCGCGIRIESALYPGSKISPYYDSMIAKVIVHAPGRLEAIRKMRVALEELTIQGVDTNVDFLYLIMFNSDYMVGNVDTGFLEKDTEAIIRWGEESRKQSRR